MIDGNKTPGLALTTNEWFYQLELKARRAFFSNCGGATKTLMYAGIPKTVR